MAMAAHLTSSGLLRVRTPSQIVGMCGARVIAWLKVVKILFKSPQKRGLSCCVHKSPGYYDISEYFECYEYFAKLQLETSELGFRGVRPVFEKDQNGYCQEECGHRP